MRLLPKEKDLSPSTKSCQGENRPGTSQNAEKDIQGNDSNDRKRSRIKKRRNEMRTDRSEQMLVCQTSLLTRHKIEYSVAMGS